MASDNKRGPRKPGPARDFTRIGQVSAPGFARRPDLATVFATRSARLSALAEGHPLGVYLDFLGRLVNVQHQAAVSVLLPPLDEARLAPRFANAMPPLSKELLSEGDGFAHILDWFLQHARLPGAPDAAEQARARLCAMPLPERLVFAETIMDGAYPADRLGESLYAAAGLQVYLTALAAGLDQDRLRPVGDGVCPACGSSPVASLIVGWADADRSRFCCCSLCGTLWNYVRIKCTTCGSTGGIGYYLIEEQSKNIAVETCTNCESYIKHLRQDREPEIESFADDIASFGLDLLVREKDFRRATANPLMVTI